MSGERSDMLGSTSPEYLSDRYKDNDVGGFIVETHKEDEIYRDAMEREHNREVWVLDVTPNTRESEDGDSFTLRIGKVDGGGVTQDFARDIHQFVKDRINEGLHGKDLEVQTKEWLSMSKMEAREYNQQEFGEGAN